jgi:hypothetical protein
MFESFTNLRFKDKAYENEYVDLKKCLLKNYMKWLLLALLIYALFCSIIISVFFKFHQNVYYMIVSIVVYITCLCYFFMLIISFRTKNSNLLIWVNYVSYFLFFFPGIGLKVVLSFEIKNYEIYSQFLTNLDMLLRTAWFLIGMNNYHSNLILNTLTVAVNWIMFDWFSNNIEIMNIIKMKSLFTFEILILLLTTYFIRREQKKSFYFNLKLKKESEWFKNILENTKNGYIFIKNNNVIYMNKFMKTKFKEVFEDGSKIIYY